MSAGAFANFRPLIKQTWWEIYGGCVYCSEALKVQDITIDHIYPQQEYPELKYDYTNCVPACIWCNTIRSNMPFEEFCEYVGTPKYWQVRRKLVCKSIKNHRRVNNGL